MLPSLLLQRAESHPCFSGCFDWGNRADILIDPAQPLESAMDVHCSDCLSFYLGALSRHLPVGMSLDQMGRELTGHVRAHRGYDLSFGGYHTAGGGFWLSAAYWAVTGVFILSNDRMAGSPAQRIDLLVHAFANGVAIPRDPLMTDPKQYHGVDCYLSVVPPPTSLSLAVLLSSSHVSMSPKPGYVNVTLAEFAPAAIQAQTAPIAQVSSAASSQPAPPSSPVMKSPLMAGERCERCGQLATERILFTSHYVTCGC